MPYRLANGRAVTIFIKNTLEALPILPWIWMVLLPASMFLPACCTSLGTSFPTCAARLKEEERPLPSSKRRDLQRATQASDLCETNRRAGNESGPPWQVGLHRCIAASTALGTAARQKVFLKETEEGSLRCCCCPALRKMGEVHRLPDQPPLKRRFY